MITRWLASFAAAVFLWGPAVLAADYKLVTGDNYAPFTTSEKSSGGLASDIIRTVFNEMGHQASIEFRPWARGYQDALSGKYLGTFPYAKNEKRQKDFLYSDPLYEVKLYFFAAEGSDARYESDDDLKGKTFCVPLGYNPVKLVALKEAGAIGKLIRPRNLENCFRMLQKKRVDFVRVNDMIGWAEISKTFGGRDGFKLMERPFDDGSAEYLIIPKGTDGAEDLLKAFNETLGKMKSDGTIHRLIERNLN